MQTVLRVLLCAFLAASITTAAVAEQELIGTSDIFFGQPLQADYINIVHPDPSIKVMSFTGTATNSGSTTVILGIHFDYIDTNGIEQIIPLANFYQNAVPGGGVPVPINAGPVQLPYCPENVSIHFELLDPGEVQFDGIFDHTCIPVPEPSTVVLLGLGGVAMAVVGLRRRRGASRP